MTFKRYRLVPARDGVPNDLPAWARDELVGRRLAMADLRDKNTKLRIALAEARGEDVSAVITEMMNESKETY